MDDRRVIFLAKPAPQSFRIEVGPGEVVVVSGTPLFKAQAIPDGARWITVHAPGAEKGSPVLIQETQHGSGTYHVIGGAGGKLNYLKLHGVKPKGDYAKDVASRQAAKREDKKATIQREKENGVYRSRQADRQRVTDQVRKAEREYVQQVAKASGWAPSELELPAEKLEKLSPTAQKAAHDKHHRELVGRAEEVSKLQARSLAIESDKRLADAVGEPEMDERRRPSLGYQPNFGARTESQAADIKAEAGAIDTARADPDKAAGKASAKEKAEGIKRELQRADLPVANIKAEILDTAAAIELLKARKKLQAVRAAARKANQSIDRGEEKAYVLEVSQDTTDAAVKRDVENDMRTLRTKAFLSEVGRVAGPADAITPHVSLGAFNALNSVALVAGGSSGLDRDVVDVLGIAGASQALAARLRADMHPADYDRAVEALQQYHVDHYMQRSQDALRECSELEEQMRELKLPDATDGHELAISHALNQRRRQAIASTQKVLGHALGEMEANAALLVAMKASTSTDVKSPLGKMRTEDAVRRMRAIGLDRGDYSLEHVGAEVIATIKPQGLLRVAKSTDVATANAVRESLEIIDGKHDDPDFWPQGIAKRPDMAMPAPEPAVSAALSQPFKPGADLAQSVRDYVGGRMADGHAIADIVADLQTEDMARMVGEDRRTDYFKSLDDVVPLSKDGKPVEAESRRGQFEQFADDYVSRVHGGQFSPIHAQRMPVDQASADALHRAFAEEPAGPLAFKATGDLEATDQGALRDYFERNIAPADEASAGLKQTLADHLKNEPEKEVDDMFGRGTNPAWSAWNAQAAEHREKLSQSGLDWAKYSTIMGSTADAYRAVQDHLRGAVVGKFHAHYSRLNPDQPLKLGRTVLSNHLRHIEAVDPASREKRMAEHAELLDSMRNRAGGRYASGSVTDKMDASRNRQAAAQQAQIGMFASAPEEKAARPMAADERPTLGVAAEGQLSQMASTIGQNFKPGQPLKIWAPGMTGKYANQQRAVKLIGKNKRVALAQGVGSGKTSMGLSAFANEQSQGNAKRGLFIVPSIVQGQFGGEALRYMEPGKFKWHAEPGASREERLAAYRDPKTHFSVVTHQSFRDDLLHLGAKSAGIDQAEMVSRIEKMSDGERKAWAAETMRGAGMDHDFMMVDEGHDLLNRAGKENSGMANVIDGASANMKYYVNASADPVKNDASEMFDLLRKMNPDKYTDRAAFMRRYGVDTSASRDQLRREMAQHFYPGRIQSGFKAEAREVPVKLSDAQNHALQGLDANVARLRMARLKNKPDIEAAKALSPDSFEGVAEDQHAAIATRLAESVGILKETATAHIINAHEAGAKYDAMSKIAAERRGKPGVIFARSRAAVAALAARLEKEGHRVVTITGSDSAKEKAAKRLQFHPEQGEATADILVASDAGAVGLNAQRGKWLAQHDTPLTAKTHAQRNGRIDRIGQTGDVELLDLVADHPQEHEARKRLKTKYGLRDIVTSPLEGLDDHGYAAYLRKAHQAEQMAMAA